MFDLLNYILADSSKDRERIITVLSLIEDILLKDINKGKVFGYIKTGFRILGVNEDEINAVSFILG